MFDASACGKSDVFSFPDANMMETFGLPTANLKQASHNMLIVNTTFHLVFSECCWYDTVNAHATHGKLMRRANASLLEKQKRRKAISLYKKRRLRDDFASHVWFKPALFVFCLSPTKKNQTQLRTHGCRTRYFISFVACISKKYWFWLHTINRIFVLLAHWFVFLAVYEATLERIRSFAAKA